jgi:hypothetical protein
LFDYIIATGREFPLFISEMSAYRIATLIPWAWR